MVSVAHFNVNAGFVGTHILENLDGRRRQNNGAREAPRRKGGWKPGTRSDAIGPAVQGLPCSYGWRSGFADPWERQGGYVAHRRNRRRRRVVCLDGESWGSAAGDMNGCRLVHTGLGFQLMCQCMGSQTVRAFLGRLHAKKYTHVCSVFFF
jgi:hypothetical protein